MSYLHQRVTERPSHDPEEFQQRRRLLYNIWELIKSSCLTHTQTILRSDHKSRDNSVCVPDILNAFQQDLLSTFHWEKRRIANKQQQQQHTWHFFLLDFLWACQEVGHVTPKLLRHREITKPQRQHHYKYTRTDEYGRMLGYYFVIRSL